MDVLKTATDWARAEIFSSSFFVLFGMLFLIASIGFWYLGKTDISRAYIVPTMVAGTLLLIIGGGLIYANHARITSFEEAHRENSQAFVSSEIDRAERTLKEYGTVVFKAIPIIIVICAVLMLLIDKPVWRAGTITAIAMLAIILLIDGTAKDRVEVYHGKLLSMEKQDP